MWTNGSGDDFVLNSVGHLIQRTRAVWTIVVDGFSIDMPVKVFRIWLSGLVGNVILRYFLSLALVTVLFKIYIPVQ